MKVGGVILCGGKSSRMGVAKALLPFGDECLLERVVRLLSEAVTPLAVVAAPAQELPELPSAVHFARDQHPDQGPLEGLRVGLAALADEVDAVYATSCDVPLLSPEFVRKVIGLLGEDEIAVPRDGQFHHPLAAVYRTSVANHIEALLHAGRRRPVFLFESCRTREIPVETLRTVDPDLQSLHNCNCPADYAAALAAAGLTMPPDVAELIGLG